MSGRVPVPIHDLSRFRCLADCHDAQTAPLPFPIHIRPEDEFMTSSARLARRDRFLASIRKTPAIMGILNATPDSFSDGGRFIAPENALAQAVEMARLGCSIIDVGGESTRPGATPVAEDEELRRVLPIIAMLVDKVDVPISVDTTKSVVAREAARLGAIVVNDVWGLQKDPGMADVVAETGSAAIVMHNRDRADNSVDIIDDVRRFFDRSISIAERAGIPPEHLILDPGIGFGKTFEQNLTCLRHLGRFLSYGMPLLLGVSRKSFIGHILDKPVEERLTGTLAANVIGLMSGASIIRVHDVEAHQSILAIFNAVKGQPNG